MLVTVKIRGRFVLGIKITDLLFDKEYYET